MGFVDTVSTHAVGTAIEIRGVYGIESTLAPVPVLNLVRHNDSSFSEVGLTG